MQTNRDQAVARVREELREMVRASARKSGDEIVTMTLRDLRALVEPPSTSWTCANCGGTHECVPCGFIRLAKPSTPTDAELELIAQGVPTPPAFRHRLPASRSSPVPASSTS